MCYIFITINFKVFYLLYYKVSTFSCGFFFDLQVTKKRVHFQIPGSRAGIFPWISPLPTGSAPCAWMRGPRRGLWCAAGERAMHPSLLQLGPLSAGSGAGGAGPRSPGGAWCSTRWPHCPVTGLLWVQSTVSALDSCLQAAWRDDMQGGHLAPPAAPPFVFCAPPASFGTEHR